MFFIFGQTLGVVGGWQTVSVRTVDEDKEREESEKAAEAMRRREYDDEVSIFQFLHCFHDS